MNEPLLQLVIDKNTNRAHMEPEGPQNDYKARTTPESLKSALIIVATTPTDAAFVTNLIRQSHDLPALDTYPLERLHERVSKENPDIRIYKGEQITPSLRRVLAEVEGSETLGLQIPKPAIAPLKTAIGTVRYDVANKLAEALDPRRDSPSRIKKSFDIGLGEGNPA